MDGSDRRLLTPVPLWTPVRSTLGPVAGMPERVLVTHLSEKCVLDLRSGDRTPVDNKALAFRADHQVVVVGDGVALTGRARHFVQPEEFVPESIPCFELDESALDAILAARKYSISERATGPVGMQPRWWAPQSLENPTLYTWIAGSGAKSWLWVNEGKTKAYFTWWSF